MMVSRVYGWVKRRGELASWGGRAAHNPVFGTYALTVTWELRNARTDRLVTGGLPAINASRPAVVAEQGERGLILI